MWCEQILYNSPAPAESGFQGREVDYIDLGWDERSSVIKKRTRGGEEVRVVLTPPSRPRHGDVLFEDAHRVVIVQVNPTEVVVAGPAPARAMAEAALELGNLHWPTQLTESSIIFPPNDVAIAVLDRLAIPRRTELRRFDPAEISALPVADFAKSFQLLAPPGDHCQHLNTSDCHHKVAASRYAIASLLPARVVRPVSPTLPYAHSSRHWGHKGALAPLQEPDQCRGPGRREGKGGHYADRSPATR